MLSLTLMLRFQTFKAFKTIFGNIISDLENCGERNETKNFFPLVQSKINLYIKLSLMFKVSWGENQMIPPALDSHK